jgi:hypothetical protein
VLEKANALSTPGKSTYISVSKDTELDVLNGKIG